MGQFPTGGNRGEVDSPQVEHITEGKKETDSHSGDMESSFLPSPGGALENGEDFTDEILQALNDYGRVGPGPGMWQSFMGAVKTRTCWIRLASPGT